MELIPFTDYDTELKTVGAIVKNVDLLDYVQTVLTVDDFYYVNVKTIYAACVELNNNGRMDARTLIEWLRQKESEDCVKLVANAVNAVSAPRMVKEYAERVAMLSVKRRAITLSQKLIELTNDTEGNDIPRFMSEVSGMVGELESNRGENMTQVKTYFKRYMKEKENALKVQSPKFGFGEIDSWSRGILKKQLVIVAGRPGTGKTAWTLQVQENISHQGFGPTPVFSMEMGKEELVDRLVSNKTGIPFSNIKHNDLTQAQKKLCWEVGDKISDMFYVDDKARMDLGYIVSQCRKLKRQHGQLGSIMVDYLGLIEMMRKKGESLNEAIGLVTRTLKQLARELDTTIFLLVQMNREIEKRGTKRPVMSDLRDSGSIEQDADMVIFLHKDEEKSDPKMSHIDLIVAKGRNTGVRDFELAFLVEIQRLVTKSAHSPMS